MKAGYMTNAWGAVVGHPGGVTSIKDLYYLSTGADAEAVEAISREGYDMIEIFDGNLVNYMGNPGEFKETLKQHKVSVFSVYTGADFIFNEIWEEEKYKIESAAKAAVEFEAKHLVLGGGAIRSTGAKDEDYKVLGQRLDEAAELAQKYGLLPSYHPHLGTIVQGPDQLDKLMALTKIDLCPDTAHIEAGGGDSVAIVKKYIQRIKYIHLKDFAAGAFLPLGKGAIDFEDMITFARQADHEIDFTVEADGYDGDPSEAARISFEYLKKFS